MDSTPSQSPAGDGARDGSEGSSKPKKPDGGSKSAKRCKPNCGDSEPYPSGLDEESLSPDGLGPIRIGMTKSEAANAAGVELVLVGDDFGRCEFAGVAGDPEGVSMMLLSGVVSRIDIEAGPVQTAGAIGIGSSAQEVFDAYPREIERVTDVYGVRQLLYTPSDPESREYSMLFSLGNRDNVTHFRAGLKEPVEYAEGCV